MSKKTSLRGAMGLAFLALVSVASAHVGVVNTQLPFAREGTYELVLAVPHGCAYTPVGGTATELDTYRVEVTTPAAFTGARPILEGAFGLPTRTLNPDGTRTFVWTKPSTLDTPDLVDSLSYRIGIRGSFRATTTSVEGSRFTAQRFNTRQFCKNPVAGQPDITVDWANYGSPAANESPQVRVLPTRQPGWNQYTLPASVAATLTTPAAVSAFVRAFFADAQIVWVGKAAYSVNTATTAKIRALALRDSSYSELVNKSSLSSTETIWVKY
jgi:periplasmic copper chaperone A